MVGSATIWLTRMMLVALMIGGSVLGLTQSDLMSPMTSAQANKTLAEAASMQADAQRKWIENVDLEERLRQERQTQAARELEAQRQIVAEHEAKLERYNKLSNTLATMVTILMGAAAAVLVSAALWMLRLRTPRTTASAASAASAPEQDWLQEEQRRLQIRERWLAQQAAAKQAQVLQAQQQARALRQVNRGLRDANVKLQALEGSKLQAAQSQHREPPSAQATSSTTKIVPGPGNPHYPGTLQGSTGSSGSAPRLA